ncbi:MAG: DUF2993 domain-containing protein, partial [Armatimonadota bacterium]|nr:DUF2993 domain-containing protein [Armatimonadota bacterium]
AFVGLPDALRGKLTSVAVSAEKVRLSQAIIAERVTASLKGVHIDPVRKKLKSIDRADFSVSLTEGQLAAFLARRYPHTHFRIRLDEGCVRVAASAVIHRKNIQATADLVPTVRNGTQVVLLVRQVRSNTVVPLQAVRWYIEKKVNPVLDITKTKLKGQLTSVTVTRKLVTIKASGQPETLKIFNTASCYSSGSASD